MFRTTRRRGGWFPHAGRRARSAARDAPPPAEPPLVLSHSFYSLKFVPSLSWHTIVIFQKDGVDVFNKKRVSLPTSAPAFSVTTELPPCSGRSEATPAACFSLRSGPSICAIGPTSSSCSPSRNSLCFEKYFDHVMFVPSLSWQNDRVL